MAQAASLPLLLAQPLLFVHFFAMVRPCAHSSSINVYSLYPALIHYHQAWIDLLPVGGCNLRNIIYVI